MAGRKETAAIYIALRLATNELRAGMQNIEKQFARIGASAQKMGFQMSAALTLPLQQIGRFAVSSFSEFDKALQDSIAIMKDVDATMKESLIKGAMDVSKQTTFSAKQAAEGYMFLASAGYSAADAIKALPVVAKFAQAGMMDLKSATEQLMDVQAALGLNIGTAEQKAKSLARIADVMARASIDTNVTIQDLSASLASKLGGALRQNNVQIETAVAGLQAFGAQGIKAEAAGTALGIVIRELGIDAIKYSANFKKLGVQVFDEQGNFRNLTSIIMQLEDALAGMSDKQRIAALASLGFTKRNTAFIQSLLGMGRAMKGWEETNKSAAGSVDEIVKKQLVSFANQMKILFERIRNVAIVIGADLAPVLLFLAKVVTNVVELFGALPKPLRIVVEIFAALVAVTGPLVLWFGLLASALGGIASLFGSAFGAAALTAIGTFVTAIGALPIAIGAAIAGGLVLLVSYWDEIKGAASSFIGWFNETFPSVGIIARGVYEAMRDGIAGILQKIYEFHVTAWTEIKSFLSTTMGDILVIVRSTWDSAKEYTAQIWSDMKTIVSDWVNWFSSYFPQTAGFLGKVWTAAKNEASRTFNQLSDLAGEAADATGGFIDKQKMKFDIALAYAKTQQEAADEQVAALGREAFAQSNLTKLLEQQQQQMISNIETGSKEATFSEMRAEGIRQTGEALKGATSGAKDLFGEMDEGAGKVDKAANAIDKLRNKLSDLNESGLKADIEKAIDKVDTASFQTLIEKFRTNVEQGTLDGLKSAINKAGNTAEANSMAREIAEKEATLKIEAFQEKMDEARAEKLKKEKEDADRLAEEHKRAYDESVSYWRTIFGQAINGTTLDLKASFSELIVGLASEFAAMMGGTGSFPQSFADLGGMIAQGIAGLFKSGGSSGSTLGGASAAANLFSSPGGEVVAPEGAIGQNADGTFMMPDGTSQAGTAPTNYAGYAAGFLQAGMLGLSASDTDRANQDNSGTGAAIGAAIGTAIMPGIGTMIGQIGGQFLGGLFKWGSQNPETQARHAFANFIEESFEKLAQVSFFGADGHLKNTPGDKFNFIEGDQGRFDFGAEDRDWADKLNALGGAARNTFLGLGEAMEEVLGLTEDVGGQIAFLMMENFGGNIDNARLLVQQLGLSMDDLIAKLVDAGKSGEMTWLAVESAIQGVTEAFKPGLVAVGDVKGAFQELVDSGGRGMAALKGVRDIAVEAMEDGLKTLEQLQQRLLADGVSPEQVQALMDALKQRGITTLEQLAEVSDRIGGGIVADMNAASGELASTWEKMGQELEAVSEKLKNLPKEIESNIHLNVDATLTDDARKVIDSGATGDALPEETETGETTNERMLKIGSGQGITGGRNLVPRVRRPDGEVGADRARRANRDSRDRISQVNYHIDARGAAPGTEHRMMEAMKKAHRDILSQAVDAVDRRYSKGGRNGW